MAFLVSISDDSILTVYKFSNISIWYVTKAYSLKSKLNNFLLIIYALDML